MIIMVITFTFVFTNLTIHFNKIDDRMNNEMEYMSKWRKSYIKLMKKH